MQSANQQVSRAITMTSTLLLHYRTYLSCTVITIALHTLPLFILLDLVRDNITAIAPEPEDH